MIHFTKMQGIGNDYVYIDATKENVPDPEGLARRISDRHFSVGSDGLVLILPGEAGADFRMRMFNADGSEAEMCGNAARCVGRYVYERGLTDRTEIRLQTGAGIRPLRLQTEGGRVRSVTVDMGMPELQDHRIPTTLKGNPVMDQPLEAGGQTLRVTCVSMGNPHAVVFTDDAEAFDVHGVGPLVENHPAFPARVNTEFATVVNRGRIRMRVWERGAGETMACGTGACATLAAAVLNGLTDREAVLALNGGELLIQWDEKTGHVLMTGPAEFVFDGEWPEA